MEAQQVYVRVMHACVEMVWVAMVMIVAISKKEGTAPGLPTWSPTVVLVWPDAA